MSERLYSAACERNREPILAALRDELPARGVVLEVASGTGMHAAWFAAALPGLTWQPTDREEASRRSVAAWCEGLPNVRPPLALDVLEPWPVDRADAVFCANMIHIAPWEAGRALLAGAARVLSAGAPLVLYGPFVRPGVETAESNLRFDADLRARDPRWGLRSLDDVVAAAGGFRLARVVELPANNVVVALRREG